MRRRLPPAGRGESPAASGGGREPPVDSAASRADDRYREPLAGRELVPTGDGNRREPLADQGALQAASHRQPPTGPGPFDSASGGRRADAPAAAFAIAARGVEAAHGAPQKLPTIHSRIRRSVCPNDPFCAAERRPRCRCDCASSSSPTTVAKRGLRMTSASGPL